METETVKSNQRPKSPPLGRVCGIRYGLLSAEEAKRISVADIYNGKLHKSREPEPNSLVDLRLGAEDSFRACQTCGAYRGECPGHPGHHTLGTPVINQLCMTTLLKILKCVCLSCGRLISRNQRDPNQSGSETLKDAVSSVPKKRLCGNEYIHGSQWTPEFQERNGGCGFISPKIVKKYGLYVNVEACGSYDVLSDPTNVFESSMPEVDSLCELSGSLIERKIEVKKSFVNQDEKRKRLKKQIESKSKKLNRVSVVQVVVKGSIANEHLHKILSGLKQHELEQLGFSGVYSHPSSMVITVLNIPSVEIRPKGQSFCFNSFQDQATIELQRICKKDADLKQLLENKVTQPGKAITDAAYLIFQSRCVTLGEPGSGRRKKKSNISDLFVVNNWSQLVSKRISPVAVDSDQIAKIKGAVNLNVATYMSNNIKGVKPALHRNGRAATCLRSRINGKTGRIRGFICGKRTDNSARCVIVSNPSQPIDEIGIPIRIAKILIFPVMVTRFNFKILTNIVRAGAKKHPGARYVEKEDGQRIDLKFCPGTRIKLQYGWIVWRYLQDGDIVLCNRQPSLHRVSIMGHYARIIKEDVMRLAPPVCPPYNADFDGDTMALYALHEVSAIAEAKEIMMASKNILAVRDGGVVMFPIQDAVFGCWKISHPNLTLEKHQYWHLLAQFPPDILSQMLVDERLPKGPVCLGREILSMILPLDFNLYLSVDPPGEDVVVKNGRIVSGLFTKRVLHSITHHLAKEYSSERAADFLHHVQVLCDEFLMIYGSSITLNDTLISQDAEDTISKMVKSVRQVLDQFPDKVDSKTEEYICNILSQLREKAAQVAIRSMNYDTNNFLGIVLSGAKGALANLAQMMSMVGLQFVDSKRIESNLIHLKHHVGVERRGMIFNSFTNGLTPMDFYAHCMATREAIIGTCIKTASTGYIASKLSAVVHSLMVRHDLSVRDSEGNVYDMMYGGDGIDPTQVEHHSLCHLEWDEEKIKETYLLDDLSNLDEFHEIVSDIEHMRRRVEYENHGFFDYSNVSRTACPVFFSPHRLKNFIDAAPDRWDQSELNCVVTAFQARTIADEEYWKHRDIFRLISLRPGLRSVGSAHIRSFFSSKRMTQEYGWNEKQIRLCFGKLRDLRVQATICPGSMPGVQAAKTIGAVLTQTTLNTHQVAGSKVKLKMGIPKFQEMCDFSKKGNIETPMMILEMIHSEDAKHIVREWPRRTLRHLTKRVDFVEDVTSGVTVGVRFHLSKRLCDDAFLTVEQVVQRVRGLGFSNVRYDSDNYDICIFPDLNDLQMIQTRSVETIKRTPSVQSRLIFILLVSNIMKFIITGIKGITSAEIDYKKDGKTYVRTEGSNLKAAVRCPLINRRTIYTNHILQVYEVYGIDAARKALANEYNAVLTYSASFVSFRHIWLLTGRQCHSGHVSSLNRHGVIKEFNSVLARCFETQSDVLMTAGIFEERDKLDSVVVECMVGKMPRIGGRMDNLMYDRSPEFVDPHFIPVQKVDETKIAQVDEESLTLDSYLSVSDLRTSNTVEVDNASYKPTSHINVIPRTSKRINQLVEYSGYSSYHFENESEPEQSSADTSKPFDPFSEPSIDAMTFLNSINVNSETKFHIDPYPFRPASPETEMNEWMIPYSP